uniref:Uncharacterized protein n=1 Tax=Odontella aurita TaxID=265563 RepID=A0A7S4N932_9STRA|mmetsp:Transcript_53100/g.158908  ORF Transcript_53100/g.158908 Transcript_53100/m.158908 type:complete len:118 (+) Transcript_53100:565-918(+)
MMHLNAGIRNISENENTGVPGFQFLNINDSPNEKKPDHETEAILFGWGDAESTSSSSVDMPDLSYPDRSSDEDSDGEDKSSLGGVNSLDDEAHVMFVHINEELPGYAFLQQGKIDPN